MNPSNFQNMAVPRPPQQGNPLPGGMQRNGATSSEIQATILQALQNHPPPPPGWQQTVPMRARAVLIHQVVTQLSIVKPEYPISEVVRIAIEFELKQFEESVNKQTYDSRCRQQLEKIHATRANQAVQQQQFVNSQQPQMALMQQQMPMQNMNHNQFPQAYGIPPQPQVMQSMQQQQLPPQQRQPQPGMMEMQQARLNGQPLIQNMAPHMPQNQLSDEEQRQIVLIAQHMAATMSKEDMGNFQKAMQNMNPTQRQSMLDRGIDPRSAWVKQQAQMKFLARKNAQQRGVQGPPSMDRGALSRQGRPPSQPPMRAQGSQPGPPPGSHQQGPFSDQFLGQQQDALRSQEAGQVVVPASNGQGAASHVRGTPHPQAQSGGGRIMQPLHTLPQQPPGFWNNPLNQQQGLAQTPQPDLPPQTPNLAHNGQTPQQQALQGQIGGLGNNRGQGTPQQSHTMPTLNRPLEPPGQATNGMSQNSVQQGAKGVTRNGLSGQDVAGQTIPGQQRPQGPTKTDVATYMRGLPSPKRKYFVAEMQKRQRQLLAERAAGAGNAQAATQPGSQGAPVVTAGGQPGRVQAGPVGNLNAPQAPMNPVNGMNGQPQPVPNGSAPAQQRYTPIPMDINTTRMMDTQEYPPNLLNNNSNFVNMPQNIKHWGQLKQWVQQNAGILPPQTMERVTALQSIIFQQKRDHAARMQQQGNARPQPGGVAPPAQMVPNQDNQPASQATPTPKPFRMPSLPPPTPQEMQAARAQLVPHMKGASDDQLRTMIMSKRQQEYLRAVQGQAGLTHQQQMQSHNMLRFQQAEAQRRQTVIGMNQHGQAQPPQRGPNQPPQAGQQWTQQPVPKQAPQTNGAQAKRQANRPGPQATVNQRAAKRNNNNDDVIEVPDPKIAQQLARPPVATNVPVPVNALPQIMAEKWSSMTDEQKARFSEQRRLRTAQAQQNGQTVQGQIPVEASGNAGQMAGRDSRLRELTLEVSRNMPPFPPIPMTPNTRARMVEKLKDASGMATRLEQSLPLFLSLSKNENKTKELLRARHVLLQQVKSPAFREPEKAIDPVDSFTINIEELDRIKSSLHQYFTHMMHAHLPKGGPNTHTYQTPPLNAANLQHQQEALNKERAASVKNNNSNRAPAAPTTSHAPFLFGSQSPQGVPHFFGGKNELTQEKLVLPVAKKRKGNNQGASAASTPAQAQATPATKSSPLPKADPPGSQCTAAAPTIKCSVPGCETGRIGFASKADLDKHVVESHEPKEPVIKDPLDAAAYAIEGMRLALNLDESGKSKPIIQQPKAEPPQAQAMKKTLSAQGVKQDVSTPMSRIPTQVGPSPSSNPLRTPQTAASETKATGKDRKTVLTAAKPPVSPAADLWANSHVKPGWFKEVFSDVSHLNRPVLDDFVVDWLRRNPFTPPSSPSSGATSKDSPHKSDISANDTLNINVSTDDDVLMAELFDDTLLGDLAGLEMDWDAATEELAAKGKRRRDGEEAVASEEWLKNWAPEKYTERKRESAQRKR